MENQIAISFVDRLLATDNIALILSVAANIAAAWFLYRRYKDDLVRIEKDRELQELDIQKELKLVQVLESLKNEQALMQKLESITAKTE